MSEIEKKAVYKYVEKQIKAAKKDLEAISKQMKKDEEAKIERLERLAKDAGNAFKDQEKFVKNAKEAS